MNEDFPLIDVHLSPDDVRTMIDRYIATLSEASQIHFKSFIDAGEPPEKAVYHAVLNEQILNILIEHIKKNESKIPEGGERPSP